MYTCIYIHIYIYIYINTHACIAIHINDICLSFSSTSVPKERTVAAAAHLYAIAMCHGEQAVQPRDHDQVISAATAVAYHWWTINWLLLTMYNRFTLFDC